MTKRTTTIALTAVEKRMLVDAAEELFSTTEVPYGVTIQRLIDDGTEIDVPAEVEASEATEVTN